MNDNEDIGDMLLGAVLLDDTKVPSGKTIVITIVVVAIVFIVCLAL